MKKALAVAVFLAVVVAACGDVADESRAASTFPGSESESDAEPVGETAPVDDTAADPDPSETTTPSDDNPVLEVTPVEPDKGEVQPPPTTAGDEVVPIEVDHPNPQVATAIADLVSRLGSSAGDIQVVVDEAVTWRDGSLGCPQPGMFYTQALVSGRRIVLEHSGISYSYHASREGDPFYCATPVEPLGDDGLPAIDQ